MAYMQESDLDWEVWRVGDKDKVGLGLVVGVTGRKMGIRKTDTISGGRVRRAAVMSLGASGILSTL